MGNNKSLYNIGDLLYVPSDEKEGVVKKLKLAFRLKNGYNVRTSDYKKGFYYLKSRWDYYLVLPTECLKPGQELPTKEPTMKFINSEFPDTISIYKMDIKAEKFRGGYKTFL